MKLLIADATRFSVKPFLGEASSERRFHHVLLEA
jgi:hypothetical protein